MAYINAVAPLRRPQRLRRAEPALYSPPPSRRRKVKWSAAGGAAAGRVGAYLYGRYRRRRRRVSLSRKVPVGIGSTTSTYQGGNAKTMPKALREHCKNNQTYRISNVKYAKITTNNYGTQAVIQERILSATDFQDDCVRFGVTGSTQNYYTTSLVYGNVVDTTVFTNQELTTSYLHIYEISPRFHMAGNSTLPMERWDTGIQYEYDGTAPTGIYLYPYEKPFRSQLFCVTYKVEKIIQIELAPGQSHKHVSTYGINKLVHGAIAAQYSTSRGFSNFRMYVASGTPINDATNNALVSTSTISIDVVTQRLYDVTAYPQTRTRTYSTNTLGAITTAKVVTDTAVINDGSA